MEIEGQTIEFFDEIFSMAEEQLCNPDYIGEIPMTECQNILDEQKEMVTDMAVEVANEGAKQLAMVVEEATETLMEAVDDIFAAYDGFLSGRGSSLVYSAFAATAATVVMF